MTWQGALANPVLWGFVFAIVFTLCTLGFRKELNILKAVAMYALGFSIPAAFLMLRAAVFMDKTKLPDDWPAYIGIGLLVTALSAMRELHKTFKEDASRPPVPGGPPPLPPVAPPAVPGPGAGPAS